MILFAECSQVQSGEVECGWDGGEEGEAPLRRLRQLGPRVQPQRGEQVRPAHVPATQQRVLEEGRVRQGYILELVGVFNKEKALLGVFSVIVKSSRTFV